MAKAKAKSKTAKSKAKKRSVFSVSETRATFRDRYEAAKSGERQRISHYGRVGAALVSAADLALLEVLDGYPAVKEKLRKEIKA